MRKFTDLSGEKFYNLKVLSLDHKDEKFRAYWKCQCDCGNISIVRSDCLKSGNTMSCGCLGRRLSEERFLKAITTHGGSGTRLYRIWVGMKYRCNASGTRTGKHYADRGIKVCDDWARDFKAFESWALTSGYESNLTIDRIDVDGNYCPQNCRWITIQEQERNKQNTLSTIYRGEKVTLKDLAERNGIGYNTLWQRIYKLNWSVDRAVTYRHGGKTI